MNSCPYISAITLDRYLSDHRPILMRESHHDYGPVPFRFFHYWFEIKGFDKLVEDSWNQANVMESNAMTKLIILKTELADLDLIIDKGDGDEEVINKRNNVVRSLQELEKLQSLEAAQKEKIKWAIEGDENSKYYHGSNSSFIALIPKTSDANMVKDFRPTSLIGSMYKIIAKILANRLVFVLGDLVNEIQSAFVADRQILDGPFIMNEIIQWCISKKKQSLVFKVDFEKAFDSVRWDYLNDVLSSPTEEFQFHKGLKQGDPLSPFLFILVMESLHISFQRVVDAAPFTYLRSKVGGLMSRLQSWNETVKGMVTRLFKWKMKTLSVGGRLTLLKSVIGSMPIYHMSLFKVPMMILNRMESIRSHFFNGSDMLGKKPTWASVIKSIHGAQGKIGKEMNASFPSIWLDIVKEVDLLKKQGLNLLSFIHKKLGNGSGTFFWDDAWHGDIAFKDLYPRAYASESCKNMDVASKLSHNNLAYSFRRVPRGGAEQEQLNLLTDKITCTSLVNMRDRWVWSLEGSGDFFVASIRKAIDNHMFLEVASRMRWIKEVPIKVNVLAWKSKLDYLPTRLNISRRVMDIESILCPMCGKAAESSRHIFFTCHIARDNLHKISR
nr:RNA-directed DNA polymerase, eukaryota, reverse transcriptase zinc-binding domain protein [Tanacetum cinerariifolium]